MEKTNEVLIIVPTYNERDNLPLLVEAIFAQVPEVDLLVVDDSSPDGTGALADTLAAKDARVHVMHRTEKEGLGKAYVAGFKWALERHYALIFEMDCDFSHPPALLPRMLEGIDHGFDVVIPSRYVPGGADRRDERLHRLLSRVLNTLATLTLDRSFRDYTSGFIAARRELFETVRLRGDYGEFFISLIVQALRQGRTIEEIPYTNLSRQRGTSKTATSPLGFAWRGRRYLFTIARLASRLSDA